MGDFKNFDDAVEEEAERMTKFQFGGEAFEVDLNAKAGDILKWLDSAGTSQAVGNLLRTFLTEEDYERLLQTKASWAKMEQLVLWLVQEMGDTKN